MQFSKTQLRMISILCMTLCHITMVFHIKPAVIDLFLLGIGNFAAPTMCYFLVEGFYNTSSVQKYALRLLGFGIIAQVPFMFLFRTYHANILITLFICLLILQVRHANLSETTEKLLLIALVFMTVCCDWGVIAPIMVLLSEDFYIGKNRYIFLTGSLLCTAAVIINEWLVSGGNLIHVFFQFLGIAAAFASITYCYDKRNEKKNTSVSFLSKRFFYLYYPFHLVILWMLSTLLNYR